ncbi:hypothetical protein [Ktedonospora formicarum]|uniref:Uncharacterized protein n=1 Tax=Ktedonospora formicarum TaxID=2778364 RepID=A0A8J3IGF4_9CHLR|nr:hypothetical protein [Ktedonospora formicarum]GHO51379.1 hypothetical protein KSX_95420 [Ktedonospora formicarum]
MQRIEEGVNRDITVLNSILLMLKRVRENGSGGNGDDKVRQVKTVLAGTLKEQKVLIFTSYHDTAAYLHQQLLDDTTWQEQAGKPVLGLISGNTKPEERRKLIERFAPIANRPPEIPVINSGNQMGQKSRFSSALMFSLKDRTCKTQAS